MRILLVASDGSVAGNNGRATGADYDVDYWD
jgi:hypothetical protein